MVQGESGHDPVGEDARLQSLQERLKDAERAGAVRSNRDAGGQGDESYRLGNRVLAELIGAPVGGALIGWVIDRLAGTSPGALLVFLFLGFIAAFRNIIRLSSKRPK